MLSSSAARAFLLSALLAVSAGWAGVACQDTSQAVDGRSIAAELGCGACHAGVPEADLARSRAPALGPGGDVLPGEFVFEYLADPEPRREELGRTRMPDFRLDEGERVALALYLGSGPPSGGFADAVDRHPDIDAEVGAGITRALGCAGCHTGLPAPSARVGPDLSREGARVRPEWLRGFLSSPGRIRTDGHPASPGARMPDFRLASDELTAIGAYLSGLGDSFAATPASSLTGLQARRVERLLDSRIACLGCHRLDARGGRLGPPLDAVGSRLRGSFVLEIIQDPGRAAPGSLMPHQPLPRAEAERLARYLMDHTGTREPSAPLSLSDPAHPFWSTPGSPDPEALDEGAALYATYCSACHGRNGDGDGWNAGSLPVSPTRHSDPALMALRPDDTLFDGIYAGAWVLDGSPWMPAFGNHLERRQIRALVAYIRTLCDCAAPLWSRGSEEER